MSEIGIILLIFLFFTKHLIVDFFFQCSYMWKNKNKINHPGGWCHAGLHGVTSFAIMIPFGGFIPALLLGLSEILLHFVIDFTKMNILKYTKWGPLTHPEFWWATGVDQYAHALTYIAWVAILIGVQS